MPRPLLRIILSILTLALVGVAVFASLGPESKSRVLVRCVDAVERATRSLEFKRAYQPFYRRILLFAHQGMGSGRDGLDSSGEALAVRFYREQVLRTKPDRIVLFDVGAFEGEYTEVLLRTFEDLPGVEVHAFEPAAPAFHELTAKFAGHSRVRLVKAALGDRAATVSLHLDPSPKMNSLVQRPYFETALATEEVAVMTLDEYCARNSIASISVLKIDVEGYEMNVLKGATRMIGTRGIGIIQFEYGAFSLANRVVFQDLFALLSRDYDVFRIVGDGLEPILPGRAVWDQMLIGGNYVAVLRPAGPTPAREER